MPDDTPGLPADRTTPHPQCFVCGYPEEMHELPDRICPGTAPSAGFRFERRLRLPNTNPAAEEM